MSWVPTTSWATAEISTTPSSRCDPTPRSHPVAVPGPTECRRARRSPGPFHVQPRDGPYQACPAAQSANFVGAIPHVRAFPAMSAS
jgi:hypothetical protein